MRLENDNTRGVTGWCLDVHDLAIAKYVAGRPKDLAYTRELARHRLTRRTLLHERLAVTAVEPAIASLVGGRIGRDFAPPGEPRTKVGRKG